MLALLLAQERRQRSVAWVAGLDGFVTSGEFVGIDTRDSTNEFPN